MKKILATLLALVLLMALLPAGMVAASSEPLSLAQLQKMYPHGAYWNHTGTINKPESYTWNPCNSHSRCTYTGSCGCNSYDGKAIQCMGFAYQLASLAYDCDPRSEWSANRSTSALGNLKAGDIVRYRNDTHSIFVTAVKGDTVTYADCNSDRRCGIMWNQTISKTKLKATFTYVKAAPYALKNTGTVANTLTIQYHAGDGTLSSAVTGYRYVVTDTSGVNLRAGAGTGNKVLTALPYDTEFVVKEGETKNAGGYTWGKTTYNGTAGWLVISDFVEKIATLREGDYYLEDGLIYRTATNKPMTTTTAYGKSVELENITAFGVKKSKHLFAGWSTDPKGGDPVYAWDDATLKAETLCPTLNKGDATITLYAVWVCDHRYGDPCGATCTRCGETRKNPHTYDHECDPECNVCGAEREVLHSYTAPCAEVCTICGDVQKTTHTFKGNICTVCGKVKATLAFITQPKTGCAKMGESVTVSVEAVGDGLTYQWYVKNPGQTKYYKSSVTTATYTTTMSDKSKNRRLLCYIYDQYGNKTYSQSVFLREAVNLITQPKSVTVAKGKSARVSVVATGDGLTYKWYVKNVGADKYVVSSIKADTYSVKMSDKVNGRRLICYVYDQYGNKVYTKTVTLKMK